jgi:hypothetical protein
MASIFVGRGKCRRILHAGETPAVTAHGVTTSPLQLTETGDTSNVSIPHDYHHPLLAAIHSLKFTDFHPARLL